MSTLFRPSELSVVYCAVNSLNPWFNSTSPARAMMFASHMGQRLTINGGTVRRTFTGTERRYGAFTHHVKIAENANVIGVVKKYAEAFGTTREVESPLVSIVMEYKETRNMEIDVVNYKPYYCTHQFFGFKYERTKAWDAIMSGRTMIARGTVLADSPAITATGDYAYGIEVPIAFTSHPSGIEDGIRISEDLVKKLVTKGFGRRTASWGKNYIPLNLYGDDLNYKPFPDIGQEIREDGLVFALREFDEDTAPVNMTAAALRRPTQFDKRVYGLAGSKVIDINVIKGTRQSGNLSVEMDAQPLKYWEKTLNYYQRILSINEKLRAQRRGDYKISKNFDRLLVEAEAILESTKRNNIILAHRKIPVDDWYVDLTYEYDYYPTIGSKITDTHGGKAVIVDIVPTRCMPIDKDGNRAHAEMDCGAAVNRLNYGRLYEQYINASRLATWKKVCNMVANGTPLDVVWEYVLGFYKILAPLMVDKFEKPGFDKKAHIEELVRDDFYLYMPTDNPVDYRVAIKMLQKDYPPCHDVVQYETTTGQKLVTKVPVLIGGLYMIVLERAGNTFAAVASAKRQHYGIPAKQSKADKFSNPFKRNPTRAIGESECRLYSDSIGGDTVAEIFDQTNNPHSLNAILNKLIRTDYPSEIDVIVDRNEIPRTGGRVKELQDHIMACGGYRFVRGNPYAALSTQQLNGVKSTTG